MALTRPPAVPWARVQSSRMKVYLSHGTLSFPGYFGERALAALREHAGVIHNPGEDEPRDEALAQAAAGCDAIIAYRGSPGSAATFERTPQLKAFLRCAVDISTADHLWRRRNPGGPGLCGGLGDRRGGQRQHFLRGIAEAARERLHLRLRRMGELAAGEATAQRRPAGSCRALRRAEPRSPQMPTREAVRPQ